MHAITSNILYNLSHFENNAQITSYTLDGRQQFYLAGLLSNGSTILCRQWQSIGINSTVPFFTVTLTLFLTKLTSVFLQKYLPSNAGLILRGVEIINTTCDAILNYAGPIMHTACLISYVAMIYLGHPLIGSLGIAGFALSLIKRQGCLPSLIENTLLPFGFIGFTLAAFTLETNPLWKGIAIIGALCNILAEVSKYSVVTNFLFQDNFTKELRSTLDQNTVNQELDYSKLKINRDALHAKELKMIDPSIDEQSVSNCNLEDLYKKLEDRINAELGEADPRNSSEGWNTIRNAVIEDKTKDTKPFNFNYGKKILTSILIKIYSQKGDDFKNSIINFAAIGKSCIEGWFRDMSFLLNPQTTDIAWMIHHTLAVNRGELINQELLSMQIQASKGNKDLFAEGGGNNNIHLTNQFNKALWHKWRSYQGECAYHLDGRNAITRFFQRYLANEKSTDSFAYQLLSTIFYQMTVTLSLTPPCDLIPQINEGINHKYTPEYTIDSIYDAIKPEYQQIHDELTDEFYLRTFRKIEWDGAITTWIASLYDRDINILDDHGNYDSTFVEKDEQKNFMLTKKGVSLLLIDLGIITKIESLPLKG